MMILKKILLVTVLLTGGILFSQVSQSQSASDNKSKSLAVYDKLPTSPKSKSKFRYYYYPNIQAYYDNLLKVYYVKQQGGWIVKDELPINYLGYSRFNRYRVILEGFFDDKPYSMFVVHKLRYPYIFKGRLPKD